MEGALKELTGNGSQQGELPRFKPTAPLSSPLSSSPAFSLSPPSYETGDKVATRAAYGTALAKLGDVHPLVVSLDGDTKNSTFADKFLAAHPQRYFEGFIAEQNMVGMAVGLATCGKIPFASTFAAFLTRAYDHIRMAAISG